MATSSEQFKLTGLARRLAEDALLGAAQANAAYLKAQREGRPFVSYLVENNILDSATIAHVASDEFGVPLFDISVMEQDPAVVQLVDERLVVKHQALPLFRRGGRLYVAVSDPTNLQALDQIKFHVGLNTEAVLVEENKLKRAIDEALDVRVSSMVALADSDLDEIEIASPDEDRHRDFTDTDVDDTPVVRFVHKLMLDAVNQGASDIHFEPYENTYRVRFRLDGILKEVATPPVGLASRIAARLKVMSRLDISERRVPQDGRTKLKLSKNRAIDFRVSTCPTLFGEKVVLRILDSGAGRLGIDSLGMEEDQKAAFLDAIHKPYGMVLVTGPTGSGKTVTLYAALNILNTEDRNISTAEDPAEINLPGINQVNVHPKAGLTFASAMRAFLRQDPDVIMVGEIRDLETAEIGIKAAQTGHMVLSTVHTNDAPHTLSRLMNMGVAPYNIASAVSLIVAQRLVRRLCKHCKKPVEIPEEGLAAQGFKPEETANLTIYGPVGCEHCHDGYRGRIGIYQIMPVSDAMGRIIMADGNALHLADQAREEGVADLRESGLKKVIAGITSLDEVNRVTKE